MGSPFLWGSKLLAPTGSSGQALVTDGSGNVSFSSVLTNPMTGAGDVIVANSSGTASRVPTRIIGNVGATYISGTVTITIASPAVFTFTAHGFVTGTTVLLTTTGALPTGLAINTTYFVIRIDADTFNLSTTLANAVAGTKINTSGSQSGTHTVVGGGLTLGQGATPGVFDGTGDTAGYVGEVNKSTVAQGSGITLTSGQYKEFTSLTLTPGAWMMTAMCCITGNLTVAAGNMEALIGTASGNNTTGATLGDTLLTSTASPDGSDDATITIAGAYVNISAATTYYAKCECTYSVGTAKAYGRFSAIRVR